MTLNATKMVIKRFGTADVLEPETFEPSKPGPGQLLLRTKAIGVNFSDILRRQDKYFQPTQLPFVPGGEVVGEIIAVGEGVGAPYQPGTRVLAILPYGGGYSTVVTAIAKYCIPLPVEINDLTATAIFIQGSTAQLMVSSLAGDLKGKTVMVNAAGGGVGALLVQLASQAGATVIAAASDDHKLKYAGELGAGMLVNYSVPGWVEQTKADAPDGVDLVFEAVGGDVYNGSWSLLRNGGKMIIYGCASGIQGNVHPEYFVDKGLSLMAFNLAHFISTRPAEWMAALLDIMGKLISGDIKVSTHFSFPLEQAAEAHRMVESRRTTGKVVLTV